MTHPAQAADSAIFRHADHRDEDCLSCHMTEEAHGELSVRSVTDCRSCHHDTQRYDDCTMCHAEGPTEIETVVRTLELSVATFPDRSLPFNHGSHTSEDCATCHTEGLALSAVGNDCTSCHEDHHVPGEVTCRACHTPTPRGEHDAEAHLGCGGSDCHSEVPFQGVPRPREFCLTCHQDLVDHRPDEPRCVECHALPPPAEADR